ncbi:MAG: hypothetical protein KJ999_21750 [Gammaproteobacteria bacterium]|nr:hypothetical protein [Gammaproteobacteria bacterium]
MNIANEPLLFPAAPRPDGAGAFSAWLNHVSSRTQDPLSEEAAKPYQHIWNSWLRSLQPHADAHGAHVPGVQWYEATQTHVLTFLDSNREGRRPGTTITDVTRRRYWRVLERIYGFAHARAWTPGNPTQDLGKDETPRSENHLAVILSPKLWRAAMDCIPSEFEDALIATRNRAVLLALFYLGLTPQEVREMPAAAVLRERRPDSPALGNIRALQLDGPGPNQRRRLEVPPELADALAQWLIVRRTYEKARTLENLFCTKRGGPITPNTLLYLVKTNLEMAADRVNGGILPPRAGPQVIRNTRLVFWLNDGVPAKEVAIRAGLKNVRGLGHLREAVNPSIRHTLAAGRDDEDLWENLALSQ